MTPQFALYFLAVSDEVELATFKLLYIQCINKICVRALHTIAINSCFNIGVSIF